MTNKYQESIDNLIEYANNRGLDRDCVDEIQSSIDDLQELNDKFTRICLELNNASFLDNDCKLMILDSIKRIARG